MYYMKKVNPVFMNPETSHTKMNHTDLHWNQAAKHILFKEIT